MSQLIERIKQIASNKLKSGESTSRHKVQSWTVRDSRPSRNRCITNPAGTFTGLIVALAIPALFIAPDSHATASTLNISITDTGKLTINIPPSSEGTFAGGESATVNITTTHAAGYNLTVKADSSTDLVGTGSNTNVISSLPTGTSIDADTFSNKNNTQYNNKWGYMPQKYNSVNNTTYRPSPSTSGDTIDSTSNSSNNSYTVSIGARVTSDTPIDSYSNTFVFAVTGNPTPYIIAYYDNSGEATGMPSNVTDGEASGETVTNAVSATIPTRANYTFKGWCSVSTSDDTCTGSTIYNPDGDGTNRNLTLNQTSSSNSFTLYAMWASSGVACNPSGTTISTILCMQDITSANKTSVYNSMTVDNQYQLYDSRDGKQYYVARLKDNHIWMTQNLDLEIGGEGVADLTSENTNLTTSGSGAYSTDYTNSNGVITWKPTAASTNATVAGTPATITNFASGSPSNSVSGWTNNNNVPYMAEGADHYVYTSGSSDTSTLDTIYNSASECTTAGHSAEECAHYHVGNYYNWTAAIASSASSNIGSTSYDNAANSICPKGWRLPKGRASSDTATTREFGELWRAAGITSSRTATSYATNGFLNIRQSPLFFVRGGYVGGTTFDYGASDGYWWASTVRSTTGAYYANFFGTGIYSASSTDRNGGRSVRCIVQ